MCSSGCGEVVSSSTNRKQQSNDSSMAICLELQRNCSAVNALGRPAGGSGVRSLAVAKLNGQSRHQASAAIGLTYRI